MYLMESFTISMCLKFKIFILNHENSTSITGDSIHVTAHNVMLYLDIIERRTNDLINVVYHLEQNMPVMQKHIMEDPPGTLHPVPIDKLVPTNSCTQ